MARFQFLVEMVPGTLTSGNILCGYFHRYVIGHVTGFCTVLGVNFILFLFLFFSLSYTEYHCFLSRPKSLEPLMS